MITKIYLLATLLTFVAGSSDKCSYNGSKKITIVGTALEDKEGPFVLVEKKGMFFLDGLEEWGEKYYGKKVKVRGELEVQKIEDKSTFPGELQGTAGTKATIFNPTWQLVE